MEKKLTDYILVLDDAVPGDLAKEIIAEYACDDKWSSYGGEQRYSTGSVIPISAPDVIGASSIRNQIDNKLKDCVTAAYKKYYLSYSRMEQGLDFLMARNCTGFRLLRYTTGESLPNHVDKHPDLITNQTGWPLVSASIQLNDDYEGGELVFIDGEMTVPPKARRAVFFPSTFLYPHSINKITSGTRYVVATWFL